MNRCDTLLEQLLVCDTALCGSVILINQMYRVHLTFLVTPVECYTKFELHALLVQGQSVAAVKIDSFY